MKEFVVFFYCAAMGFVMAGVISTFYQWITSERAEFFSTKTGVLGWAITIVLSMFGGPFIVSRYIFNGLKSRELRPGMALVGSAVVAMWSVFAGIFFVSLLVAA